MVEHRQEQRARRDLVVQVSGRVGEYDPETCYAWNSSSEKLDSEFCG